MNAVGIRNTVEPSPWKQASDEHACDHSEHVRLTVYTASNATTHYRRQCSRCGVMVGAVKKSEVTPAMERDAVPFDESIGTRWFESLRARSEELRRSQKAEFDTWYEEYLGSPEWEEKRAKVFARAGGRCEGCGERRATQVHHLTYTHVGRELLFQLVAVCRDCHEDIHRAQTEAP